MKRTLELTLIACFFYGCAKGDFEMAAIIILLMFIYECIANNPEADESYDE